MSDQTFLVGTGSDCIYTCRLTADGQLLVRHQTSSGKGPSWLLVRENFLYATNEQENQIETFSIDDRTEGRIASIQKVSSQGATPCSLDIDATGKWLAVANYGGSGDPSFALLSINDRHLPDETNVRRVTVDGHGPNTDRQDKSHCHQVVFHDDYLIGIDLGTDTINLYRYTDDTDQLQLIGDPVRSQPGAGPRHILFHSKKPLAFVVNELDSTTSVYRVDSNSRKLELKQTITTRRDPNLSKENTPAELHFSPDGKYLLVSNRGDETLVIYHLNENVDEQVLSIKDHLDIRGSGPRYFTFDPTGRFLLIANENSNNLTCFSYDHQNGSFQFLSQLVALQTPQHLVFLS